MALTELLDVVDHNDCAIDVRPRQEIHRLKLRHRSVHVLVFNLLGQIFLQRRSWRKDVAPNLWDTSAAGHLDHRESYDDAALRELTEELRISGVPLVKLFKLAADANTGWEFVWVYRCVTDQTPIPDPEEIAEGRWFTRAQLQNALVAKPDRFTITFRLLWQRLGDTRSEA